MLFSQIDVLLNLSRQFSSKRSLNKMLSCCVLFFRHHGEERERECERKSVCERESEDREK